MSVRHSEAYRVTVPGDVCPWCDAGKPQLPWSFFHMERRPSEAQKRLPVRKIREVLRLKAAGVSDRKIASAIGCSCSTVQLCLKRAAAAGIGWPLPDELNDAELEAKLYPKEPSKGACPEPDFARIHRELSRPGVTHMLLWQEYKAAQPKPIDQKT